MALTIRLTEEQEKGVNKLMEGLNIKSASGAMTFASMNYLAEVKKNKELREKIEKLERTAWQNKRKVSDFKEALDALISDDD